MSTRHDMGTLVNASLSKNPEKPGWYILDLEFTTTYNGMRDAMNTVHECYSADQATCLRTLESLSRALGVPSLGSLDQVLESLRRIEGFFQKR